MKVHVTDAEMQAGLTVETTAVTIEGIIGSKELELMRKALMTRDFTLAAHESLPYLMTRGGADEGPGTREIWVRQRPKGLA